MEVWGIEVTVKAPSRLHFGIIDMRGDLGRLHGSVGVATEEPTLILKASKADTVSFEGYRVKRLEDYTRKVLEILSGSDDEIVSRLVNLIESDLGELPVAKLHCPPATVQAFLEAIAEYSEKQADTETSSRARRPTPLLASYFDRKTSSKADSQTTGSA